MSVCVDATAGMINEVRVKPSCPRKIFHIPDRVKGTHYHLCTPFQRRRGKVKYCWGGKKKKNQKFEFSINLLLFFYSFVLFQSLFLVL